MSDEVILAVPTDLTSEFGETVHGCLVHLLEADYQRLCRMQKAVNQLADVENKAADATYTPIELRIMSAYILVVKDWDSDLIDDIYPQGKKEPCIATDNAWHAVEQEENKTGDALWSHECAEWIAENQTTPEPDRIGVVQIEAMHKHCSDRVKTMDLGSLIEKVAKEKGWKSES